MRTCVYGVTKFLWLTWERLGKQFLDCSLDTVFSSLSVFGPELVLDLNFNYCTPGLNLEPSTPEVPSSER